MYPLSHTTIRAFSALLLLTIFFIGNTAIAEEIQEGKIHILVKKNYGSWENPLHSELIINHKTVDFFSSDTIVPIEEYLQAGWNDIAIKTTPQEPANKMNYLIFKIGPMVRTQNGKFVMSPVLWEFRNGTDWDFNDGTFLHTLGPDVKEVTLNYHLFWGGLEHEGGKLKTGDYVLNLKPYYDSWNSPLVTTVAVNGTPFNSFLGSHRRIILNSLLKPGKNEVRVITHKVDNAFKINDFNGEIGGPAQWSPGKKAFILTPITSFKAMQGWKTDKQTGQLNNPKAPESPYIERTITFMVKGLEEEPVVESAPSTPDPQFKKSSI
jgi:hypothetical protein